MNSLLSITVADGVATITLDDPSAPVNTISPAWIAQMTQVFTTLAKDDTVSGIIVTSAKPGFMAGADLKFILDNAATMTTADAFDFSQGASRLFRLIETCGKPVVAAINGAALGGGYELALACTHRILADDRKAVVGLPEVNVGLLPGAGGTQRLPRMIGVDEAVDVLLGGVPIAPAKALTLGLVDAVVPPWDLMAKACAWLATKPSATRPWDHKGFRIAESEGLIDPGTAAFFSAKTARIHAKYGDN